MIKTRSLCFTSGLLVYSAGLSIVTILATMSALSEPARAATLYWDVNGAAAGFGGAGTWDTTTANWNDSTGTGLPGLWTNGNDAVFQGTVGVVTMGAGITANNVTVNNTTGTYNFTGGSLTLSSFTTSTTTGLNYNLNTNVSGTDITLINPNTLARTAVVNFNSATNSFTGDLNLTGAGTPTSNGFRLQVNVTQVGAIPATADINYARNFSQFSFNAAGTHNVPNNLNLNSSNIGGAFESWFGAAVSNIVNMSGLISGNSTLTFGLGASGGAGLVTLSNNNTYTGDTKFLNAAGGGVIRLGVGNALPTTTGLIFGSGATPAGSLDLNGLNQTVASLHSGATTGAQNGIVNNLAAGPISILTINGSATTTYTGQLGSATNTTNLPNVADHHKIKLVLDAANTGQLTLTGPSNGGVAYSGGTEVNGGTLVVANTSGGSGTGTGPVTVGGGTLKGTGSMAGSVTVTSGTLAPGNSIGTIGVGGALSMTGGTYAYEFNSSAQTGDVANVGGALNLSGLAQLALSDGLDAALALGTKFTLISYLGAWDGGEFVGYGDDTGFVMGSNTFRINYDDTTTGSVNGGGHPNAVTMVVIPEPASLMLLSLAGLAVVGYVRRR